MCSGVFACAYMVYMHVVCVFVCMSCVPYIGTLVLCVQVSLCVTKLCRIAAILQFPVRQISQWRILSSLTIGGFTQPAVARPIIELPSNVEKGLSSRFLCFFFFFPNLATASLKPLSLLMMTSPELSCSRCVQC